MSKENFEADFSAYKRTIENYERELINLLDNDYCPTQRIVVTDVLFNKIGEVKHKIENANGDMHDKYSKLIQQSNFFHSTNQGFSEYRYASAESKKSLGQRIDEVGARANRIYQSAVEAHQNYLRQKPNIDHERKRQEEAERERRNREEAERQHLMVEQQLAEERRQRQAAEQRLRETEIQRQKEQQEAERKEKERAFKDKLKKQLKPQLDKGEFKVVSVNAEGLSISYTTQAASPEEITQSLRALKNQLRSDPRVINFKIQDNHCLIVTKDQHDAEQLQHLFEEADVLSSHPVLDNKM